jgi:hypothetical protein
LALPTLVGTSGTNTGGAAATPAPDAGTQTGDLGILVGTTIAGGSCSVTANGGFGTWTLLPGLPQDVTGGEKLYVWYAYATQNAPTGPTVTAGGDHVTVSITIVRGAAPSSPIHVSAVGSETASDTTGNFVTGISSTVNDCLVFLVSTSGQDTATAQHSAQANTSLASVAERADRQTQTGGGGGHAVATGTKVTAGTLGTWTWTLATAHAKAYITFAVAPLTAVEYTDSGTVPLALTVSGDEFPAKEYTDADTSVLTLTASGTEFLAKEYADSGTVYLTVRPFTVPTLVIKDEFNRTVALGLDWGTANLGGNWMHEVGTASVFKVENGVGVYAPIITTPVQLLIIDNAVVGATFDILFRMRWAFDAVASSFETGVVARYEDTTNFYDVRFAITSGDPNTLRFAMFKSIGGTRTIVGSEHTLTTSFDPGEWWWVRWQASGESLRAKSWKESESEPDWQVSGVAAEVLAGFVGWYLSRTPGTEYGDVFFDSLVVYDAPHGEAFVAVDSTTVNLALTPSGTEFQTFEYPDSGTVPLALTPSGTDEYLPGATEYTDSATAQVTLTPSAVETREQYDAATAQVFLTPSVVEGIERFDADTARVTFTPSVIEGKEQYDAVTAQVLLTPSAQEGKEQYDAATAPVLLTPSAAEVREQYDADTVQVRLTVSSIDIAEYYEFGFTVPIALTPSGTDEHTTIGGTEYTDQATVTLALSSSALEERISEDAATALLALLPSTVEERVSEDAATALLTFTPSYTEIAELADAQIVPVVFTPSGLDQQTGAFTDADIIILRLTPSAVEVYVGIALAITLTSRAYKRWGIVEVWKEEVVEHILVDTGKRWLSRGYQRWQH